MGVEAHFIYSGSAITAVPVADMSTTVSKTSEVSKSNPITAFAPSPPACSMTLLMASFLALITSSVNAAVATGLLKEGDIVVLTAGVPVGEAGRTNLLKVHVVGEMGI